MQSNASNYQYFYNKLGSNQRNTTAVISCRITMNPYYVALKNVNVILEYFSNILCEDMKTINTTAQGSSETHLKYS